MQEYRVICKSEHGFLNAVLAATHEDTMLEIKESSRELVIPEFKAYRTGLPEIRKILKSRDVMLRAQYFTYGDYDYIMKEDVSPVDTGTSGNLKKIDTGYQKGAFMNAFVPVRGGDRVYIYNNFKIIFKGPDRVPTLRYKPVYSNQSPVLMSIRELIEVYHGNTYYFGSDPERLRELKVMCKLLPKLVRYSP
jgi:hypothetical protein